MAKTTLGDLLGNDLEEDFFSFDLSEIQELIAHLAENDPIDIAHAENLQQKALRGADILSEFLGKIIKLSGTLEAKVNAKRNAAALSYKNPDGSKTTTDLRKFAAEASPEVEEISIKLAKIKASKSVLEKKYDILIKSHHHYKDIAAGLRKTIVGYSTPSKINSWE